MRHTLSQIQNRLESFIDMVGRALSWLTLLMVLVMASVVLLRYVFDIGWIWLQEIVNYLHAYIFMLGAAYTLRHDGHVRVDVFYRDMTPIGRARIDLLGSVFLLLPMCVFIFYVSWPPTANAWLTLEGSQRTGGLDFAYVLFSSMLLMPALLILQAIAIMIKTSLSLLGDSEHTHG